MNLSVARPVLRAVGKDATPGSEKDDGQELAKEVAGTQDDGLLGRNMVGTVEGIELHFAPSDEALMARVCDGDKDALACLFRRYARIVRGIAYRVLRDPSEADDLLQDIFLLIQRKCDMFDSSRGPARFWILQMTYHRAIARRRYLNSRHFYTRVDLDDAERDLAIPANCNLGAEASRVGLLGRSDLKRIFEGLSEDQQETLQLFFVEGYTLPEIATKLNQTRGNVKHHYFRGLEKLRKHFFDSKLQGSSTV